MSESKQNGAVDAITKDFTETSKNKPGFGKTVKLDFGSDGVIIIDGTGDKIAISKAFCHHLLLTEKDVVATLRCNIVEFVDEIKASET